MTEVQLSPQDMTDPDRSGDLSPSRETRETPQDGIQPSRWTAPPQTEILERLAHRDIRIAELVAALEQERVTQQNLRQDLETRIEEIAQLTIWAHDSETELKAMRADLGTVIAERDRMRDELAALIGERDALRTSTSWKLTAPIRWISLRLRGHRS